MSHRVHSSNRYLLRYLLLLIASAMGTWESSADEIILRSGGRVYGYSPLDQRTSQTAMTGTTKHGIRVTLSNSLVADSIRESPDVQHYHRIAPQYANSAEAQWELAEWCRAASLNRQREIHLQRILQLQPDHAGARLTLGFTWFDNRWMTVQERMTERGYRHFEGRWRMPLEIALIVARREHQRELKGWVVRLRRWREQLNSRRSEEASEQILAIRHVAAVPAITQMYAQETDRSVKLLLLQPLAQTDSDQAAAALINISLDEDDEEVRLACLDHLMRQRPPRMLADYVAALSDRDNRRVNRAARALARLQDVSAVGPLIKALVTEHVIILRDPHGRNSETVTTTFSSNGPGLLVGRRDHVSVETKANQDVLAALVELTQGVNYHFEQDAWRSWHEAQRQAVTFNARR